MGDLCSPFLANRQLSYVRRINANFCCTLLLGFVQEEEKEHLGAKSENSVIV
ncbi:MAG: hypothetical protein ACMXYF_04460 [Candidatus Woesearchaeota archaeon]